MCNLSPTILFKLVHSYLIAQKFTQWPGVNTKEFVRQITPRNPGFTLPVLEPSIYILGEWNTKKDNNVLANHLILLCKYFSYNR